MNKIIVQYQPHQELTNKNSQIEMDRQLRKMETPHNQTTYNQTTQNKHYHKNKR